MHDIWHASRQRAYSSATSEFSVAYSFVTPRGILAALFGFLVGGSSLAVNPFFASSLIGVARYLIALGSAAKIENVVVQGRLRIFAIIGIPGATGGVIALLFSGVGVRS
ncbi:hypothetical protein GCM10007382_02710 [Salinibacterium xinjiangense]|uniref:hypothetical protein n=1 Tax=Salinibacterium xinjiangense TaxID=386302 RepID=UPI0011798A24|nr:hypothetical protein [Salinibacterium xinjiangense]GGK86148.1 hypothetical protein GCM10007382_02710 [Salinibacterium xinjiangense]